MLLFKTGEEADMREVLYAKSFWSALQNPVHSKSQFQSDSEGNRKWPIESFSAL